MKRLHLLAVLAVGLAIGCGDGDAQPEDGGQSDAPTVDAGPAQDDGGADDGGADAGEPEDAGVDGGEADGGAVDAGPDDAGPPSVDGGPCVIERATRTAQATWYSSGATRSTYCGAGLSPSPLRAAVSPAVYMAGASCGTCMRVTGATATAVVLIDDLCPECATHDLDLTSDAFTLLTGATDGRQPVTWQLVPCEPSGNVQYDLQGSNPYYVKLRVSEHVTPVTALEIRLAGGTFVAASRTTDGYFTLTPGEMLPLPLAVRVTDVFGSTIEFTVPDLTNGMVRDTGAQFPLMCAP